MLKNEAANFYSFVSRFNDGYLYLHKAAQVFKNHHDTLSVEYCSQCHSTLWKVDDEKTKDLMTSFYRYLLKRNNYSQPCGLLNLKPFKMGFFLSIAQVLNLPVVRTSIYL